MLEIFLFDLKIALINTETQERKTVVNKTNFMVSTPLDLLAPIETAKYAAALSLLGVPADKIPEPAEFSAVAKLIMIDNVLAEIENFNTQLTHDFFKGIESKNALQWFGPIKVVIALTRRFNIEHSMFEAIFQPKDSAPARTLH